MWVFFLLNVDISVNQLKKFSPCLLMMFHSYEGKQLTKYILMSYRSHCGCSLDRYLANDATGQKLEPEIRMITLCYV